MTALTAPLAARDPGPSAARVAPRRCVGMSDREWIAAWRPA